MSIKNLTLLILLWLLPIISSAQKLEFKGDFLLFREAKTKQPVLIVNDSLMYKGLKPVKLPFKHNEYPSQLNEYVSFNIGTKTYLVHDGCGPVLEFRNDSIVRINDAYLQRNQFTAVHFVFQNEIYFFGGYGLFTTKNILTKYNFKTKDWIEVQTRSEKYQEPRSDAYSYILGEDLYVFGGILKDENNVPNSKPLDNKLWRLHLPTMRWFCEGNVNSKTIEKETEFHIQDSKKLYIFSRFFSEIDLRSNKIYVYNRNYFPNLRSSYLESDTLIGVYRFGSSTFFQAVPLSDFKGSLIATKLFLISPYFNTNFLLIMSIFLFGFFLFGYLFRKQIKAFIKPFRGIIYKQQKHVFLYKGKQIDIFGNQEKILLFYILEHLNQYVSLNDLNQLFENKGQVETISATVKRREQAVSGLLAKVSKITGIEETKLQLERKNSDDKRIKDILLLNNLLKKEI